MSKQQYQVYDSWSFKLQIQAWVQEAEFQEIESHFFLEIESFLQEIECLKKLKNLI